MVSVFLVCCGPQTSWIALASATSGGSVGLGIGLEFNGKSTMLVGAHP